MGKKKKKKPTKGHFESAKPKKKCAPPFRPYLQSYLSKFVVIANCIQLPHIS